MSRTDLLLRIRKQALRGKSLPTESPFAPLYPRTRIDTMFNFVLEGRANNACLSALLHFKEPLPYEPLNTFIALVATDGGGSFADIGANIGYFSLLAACNASQPVTVHAFEPSGEEYPYLVGNAALNGKQTGIHTQNIGLGDADGEGQLSIYGTGSSFMRGWDKGDADTLGTQTVPVRRLDSVFPERNLDGPIVAKVDVEGFELHVLRGGENFFTNPDLACVLIEATHEMYADRHNPDAVPAIQLLEQYGFTCYGIKNSIPAIRDTEPDPKSDGLVPRAQIPQATSSPEAWPHSWVCLRPEHPLSKHILSAMEIFPAFLATYLLTEETLQQILASMAG